MAEILRLNAIIQMENMKGNMFVFSILRTWQNIFEVFQLIKNVRIIVHKKEELMKIFCQQISVPLKTEYFTNVIMVT